jgi:hypothetical protein
MFGTVFSGLISFFGGSVFRMLWGEVSHWVTSNQDHKQELEKLKLQMDIDAAHHAQNLEAMKAQADLKVQVIEAQGAADVGKLDAQAFVSAVADIGKPTGIQFVDAWNGLIRPILATEAIIIVAVEFVHSGFVMTAFIAELVGAILGMYVADRSLAHRGK